MSQSPAEELRIQRYEDGWEAINRMIREDLSWGGLERNCFHIGTESGFVNISPASGIDFLADGRAMCVLDFDRDGQPDLLLRDRTAPQVRLLRNAWPHAGSSLWFRLEGSESNRNAVGARITVRAGDRTVTKEVQAGVHFLSQSSWWIPIGLDEQTAADEVTVRWPSGKMQTFQQLAANRRYRLREGDAPRAVELRPSADRTVESATATRPPEKPVSSAVQAWLVDPLPAPDFRLPDQNAGRTGRRQLHLGSLRGRPALLHFFSLTCAVCRAETKTVVELERVCRDAEVRMVHLAVVPPEDNDALANYLRSADYQAPVVKLDEATLRAYEVTHRHLFSRRTSLGVPTSLLLDAQGRIVKAYRGSVSRADLKRDLALLSHYPKERLQLALPFRGPVVKAVFRRDTLALGNAYLESGLFDLARRSYGFSAGTSGPPAHLDQLYNYAVACSRAGRVDEAEKTYREVLRLSPSSDDARNNLGVLLARHGREAEAAGLFRVVVRRNPAHAEAVLNLVKMLSRAGRLQEVEQLLREAIRADPESGAFRRQLGYCLYQTQRRDAAIQAYRRALDIDTDDAEARLGLAILLLAEGQPDESAAVSVAGLQRHPNHAGLHNTLGMARLSQGQIPAGVAALRKAIECAPGFDRPYLNLARHHLQNGELGAAVEICTELLKIIPKHPEAQKLRAAAQERR